MGLDAIPPDQRAVLQLVLQQGRSYEDLAGLLGIEPETVRGRAHDALAALGPAGTLSADEQSRAGDYLLGQAGAGRGDAEDLFERSAAAREWAEDVRDQLEEVAPGRLPELPQRESVAPPPPERPEPVSALAREPERRP